MEAALSAMATMKQKMIDTKRLNEAHNKALDAAKGAAWRRAAKSLQRVTNTAASFSEEEYDANEAARAVFTEMSSVDEAGPGELRRPPRA